VSGAEDAIKLKLEQDVLEFVQTVGGASDDVACVLRLHALCELFLDQVITSRIVRGNLIVDDDRFTFHHKLQVAAAIGGLDPYTGGALRKLTKLRNRCAHERRPKIAPAELIEIGEAAGPHFQAALSETKGEDRELQAMAWVIFSNMECVVLCPRIVCTSKGKKREA
jgi:hypothetical protein